MKRIAHLLICLLLAAAGAFGIELLVYNAHPLLYGDQTDYTYTAGTEDAFVTMRQNPEKQNVRIIFSEPVYVKKLYLEMTASGSIPFTLTVDFVNALGQTESEKVTDTYNPESAVNATKLERKVSSLLLHYEEEMPEELLSLRVVNTLSLNRYRAAFWFLTILLALFFLMGREIFEKHPERVMAVCCLTMGAFIIFCQGINENGWDEQVHFKTAWNLSYTGSAMEDSAAYQAMTERIPITFYSTLEEKAALTARLNAAAEEITVSPKSEGFSYSKIAYIFQAAFLWIGRALGLSFSNQYMLGKLANLLTYVVLMYAAIRVMPSRREEFAALALIPTQVFVASTYTYDVMLNGLFFLGFAFWLRLMREEKSPRTMRYLCACGVCFCIGSLSKLVYIPILLLCLAVPAEKFPSKRLYRILRGTVLAAAVIGCCAFAVPALMKVMNNEVGVWVETRLTDVDIVRQLKVLLGHIPQYLWMMVQEFFNDTVEVAVGTQALANFGRMKEIDARFQWIMLVWFFWVMAVQRDPQPTVLKRRYRAVFLFVLAAITVLIETSMYLAATSVGLAKISGVQGRYFFPLLPLLLIFLENKSLRFTGNRKIEQKLLCGVPTAVLLFGIYENMLANYCF